MSKLFKALNHPQQVKKRGANDAVDDRHTPDDLFNELAAKHGGFTLDAAASDVNKKCARWFTKETDGLAQSWAGERVWLNPPYSEIRPWVEKALRETAAGCPIVAMLLPNNRSEQPWWQDLIEPVRDGFGDGSVTTYNIRKRRNFGNLNRATGEKWNSSPPFGLVLVVFRGRQ